MRKFAVSLLFLFFTLVFVFFVGCSLFETLNATERVKLSFPDMPGSMGKALDRFAANGVRMFFEVRYFRMGEVKTISVRYENARNGLFWVEMDRGVNTPVTFGLVLERDCSRVIKFKEGGGVFPFDANRGADGGIVLYLSWIRGPIASMFMKIKLAGGRIDRFNTKRLYMEVDKLNLKDPWLIDWHYVGLRLSAGYFRVTYLKFLYIYDLSVVLGLEGMEGYWFFNTPFTARYTVSEEGRFHCRLSEGFYSLFSLDGKGEMRIVNLTVGEGGRIEIFSQ